MTVPSYGQNLRRTNDDQSSLTLRNRFGTKIVRLITDLNIPIFGHRIKKWNDPS